MGFKMIIFSYYLRFKMENKRKIIRSKKNGKGKRPGKDGNKISDAGRQGPKLFQHMVWARDRPSSTKYANNSFGNPISESRYGTIAVHPTDCLWYYVSLKSTGQRILGNPKVLGTLQQRRFVGSVFNQGMETQRPGSICVEAQGILEKVSAELRVGMQPTVDNFIGFFHAINWKNYDRGRQQLLIFNINPAAREDRKCNEESRFPAHVEIHSPAATVLAEYDRTLPHDIVDQVAETIVTNMAARKAEIASSGFQL
ncbi:hypothetical protein Tco_0892041 [Tanacetum coccineum]|uniref:Uncharacterized protein n=1 Tax=Tanacetum coccineum TaxID=301880 RepID=A0ABQ5CAS6_9ASTR